jgi:serpin B
MNADKLDLIVTNLTKTFLSVNIPKFGFDSRSDLAKFLADQGAQVALDDRADFSAMDGTHGLPLKSALHLTHIRVDEEGTTASAASIMDKAAGGSNIHFTADRPFLFLIRDRETGTVLFIGRVADPS